MMDENQQLVDAGVGLVSAVVTWLVYAATTAALVNADALDRFLPFGVSRVGESYAVESVGYLDVLWKTLSLSSFRLPADRSPWLTIEPVLETAPTTLRLLAMTAGFVVLVAGPLVLFAHLTDERRISVAVGLLGGVPSIVVICYLFQVGLLPRPRVAQGESVLLVLSTVAVGLPLALGLTRLGSRAGSGNLRRTARNILLEGWLYVLWLPGAILVAEAFLRVRGSTSLLLYSFNTATLPGFVQGTSLFVLPVLAGGIYRDVLLAFLRPDPTRGESSDTALTDGGVASVRRPFVAAARECRVVHLGGAALAGLLVVGVVGTLSLSAAAENPASPPLAVLLEGVWMATGTAVVAFVVATVVGLGLGVVAARGARWRHLPRLLDPVGLLPSFVLLLAVPMLFAPVGTHLVAPLFGTLAGLAVAPVVARRYRYGVRDADRRSPALAAAGVASTGAGLATLTLAQLTVTVPGSSPLSFLVLAYKLPSLSIPLAVMFGLPAVAMFVLGEGLHRYEPPT